MFSLAPSQFSLPFIAPLIPKERYCSHTKNHIIRVTHVLSCSTPTLEVSPSGSAIGAASEMELHTPLSYSTIDDPPIRSPEPPVEAILTTYHSPTSTGLLLARWPSVFSWRYSHTSWHTGRGLSWTRMRSRLNVKVTKLIAPKLSYRRSIRLTADSSGNISARGPGEELAGR